MLKLNLQNKEKVNISKFQKRIFVYNNYFLNFFYLTLFITSYYFYYLSLEKCMDGFDICGQKATWIIFKLEQAIISYVILAILLQLMIIKFISKYHLLHVLLTYIFFYNYSHGLDFDDHGYFNFIGCISIVSLILIAFIPFNVIIILYKKKRSYCYKYIGILFIILLYYLYFVDSYMNCKDWGKGLNNTYIDNNMNKHGCYIKIPKICPYKIGRYIFDLTKWKNIKCHENKENTKKVLLKFSNKKYINESTKRIGFPLVNKYPDLLLNFNEKYNKILNYTKENLVDMDNIDLVNKIYKENKPELIVDYTKNKYGEILINLNYNETLSKERRKLEINSNPYSRNVIILYIDSISRAYSIRQLKRTLKFFEHFIHYKGGFNQKFPSENFHSFQFFKYHSFKGYTFFNYPRIFYGSVAGKNIIRITKYYKEKGYVTSYSSDLCLREVTVTLHDMTYEEIGDHELIICDPNKKSCNILVKRCLYNKLVTEHLYEYGKQFWRKYKNNRKLLIIASNDGHEGTLEILKYLDNILFNFINDLYKDNLLKDTTVFLMSDHGTALPSPYYMADFFKSERALPMLYIICNDRKNISYHEQYKNIRENQQILITGYDIYNTLVHILLGNEFNLISNKTKYQDIPKSRFGQSLFNYIKSKDRKPEKYTKTNNKMDLDICIT